MKTFLILLIPFWYSFANAQNNIKSHERIALDYLIDTIIDQQYVDIDYFIFDGNISNIPSASMSFCQLITDQIDSISSDTKIGIPLHKKIYQRKTLKSKLNKRRTMHIIIFKAQCFNDKCVVVIELYNKESDALHTFILDRNEKKVLNTCYETRYH